MDSLDDGAILAVSGEYGMFAGSFDLDAETEEILRLKQDAGKAVLEMGRRLIRVKEHLEHGQWLVWLSEAVEFSERSAQNLMKLSREWSNPHAVADLGYRKALTLLALPADERETFLAESHMVNGEAKTVGEMTTRQLEAAIRERDEARRSLADTRADLERTEQSREEMAAEMRTLKEVHAGTVEELEELRQRPVEVAVQTVRDEEAIEEAREAVRAEMREKLDAAEAARAAAEKETAGLRDSYRTAHANEEHAIQRRAELEEELAAAKAELERIRATASATPSAAQENAQTSVAGDPDVALFERLFDQAQADVNQLHGLLLKVRQREGGQALAEKLVRALLALADAVKEVAA